MPVAAVDHLQTMGISDPALTPDSWGGYVIYRLYPRNKIVLDDRHDFLHRGDRAIDVALLALRMRQRGKREGLSAAIAGLSAHGEGAPVQRLRLGGAAAAEHGPPGVVEDVGFEAAVARVLVEQQPRE